MWTYTVKARNYKINNTSVKNYSLDSYEVICSKCTVDR